MPRITTKLAVARRALRQGTAALARSASLEAPAVVVANATALPGWVQLVHPSHQPVLAGGVMGCGKYAAVSMGTKNENATGTALARPCDGVMRFGNPSRLGRLCVGHPPHQLNTWPDGLVEGADVRPVVHLDRFQEERRISFEGTLVGATRRRAGWALQLLRPVVLAAAGPA